MSADLLLSSHPPLLPTPCLARAVAAYEGVFGFECVQFIPGVCARLRHEAFELQLWQQPLAQFVPQVVRLAVSSVFAAHVALARRGRTWLEGAPALQAWGAWEFGLADVDGNRLRCVQWVPAGQGLRRAAGPQAS